MVALTLFTGACRIDNIDFEGKTCSAVDPCPTGWNCNGGRCSSGCAYNVAELATSWQAPNALRWVWQTEGDLTQLAQFELELATDAGVTHLWTRDDNPELGTATIKRASGISVVRSTLTTALQPNTTYAAQLRAFNSDGCISRSSAIATTGPGPTNPNNPVAIFDSTAAEGFSIPSSMQIVSGGGAVSNRHLEYRLDTDPEYADAGNTVGFQNLRRAGLPGSLIVRQATTQFATAYLELYIRYAQGAEPGWYAETWLRTYQADGGSCDDSCVFGSDNYTLPVSSDGGFRRYQFPLSALKRRTDGGAFTSQDLAHGVEELKLLGSLFSRGSVLSIDGVRIWY